MEESPTAEAVNILTYIDRLDRREQAGIRAHYNMLSERCNPNYLGHHGMFSSLNTDTGTTTFSECKAEGGHRDTLMGAILLLLLDERCLDRLKSEMDRIVEFETG